MQHLKSDISEPSSPLDSSFLMKTFSAKQWNRLSPWTRRAEDLNQFKNMLDVDKKRESLEFDFD
jgi:hypothetical protein